MRPRFAALLLIFAIPGVLFAGQPTYPAFPQQEYAKFAEPGTGIIQGQAFLKTVGGQVRVAAGADVTLDPVTSYSRLWWESAGSRWAKKNDFPPAAKFREFRRVTQADSEGKFHFKKLPAGDYYLRTVLVWSGTQGGLLIRQVHIASDDEAEVMLTEMGEYGHVNMWSSDMNLEAGRP